MRERNGVHFNWYIYPVPRFAHVTAARFIRRLTRKPKREATRPARGRRVREPPCTRRRDPRAAADMRPRGGRGATKGKGATRGAPGANTVIVDASGSGTAIPRFAYD